MNIEPEILLDELKQGAHPRTQRSLAQLNEVLHKHYESGERDFSVTTVGRLSEKAKGPGYSSIRSTRNVHYRRLIEAWAAKAGTNMKKPLAQYSRQREIPTDRQLLERLSDPALRAVFGQIISERDRLKREVKLLKQNAEIVIDKRPVRPLASSADAPVQVLPALSGILTEMEAQALRYAISDECFEKMGWQSTKAGQVKCEEYRSEVYPRGYVNGIRKVLEQIENEQDNSR